MSATCVTSDPTLAASSCVLASQWKHVSTVTAPIRADIRDGLKPVRNPMVKLVLVILLLRNVSNGILVVKDMTYDLLPREANPSRSLHSYEIDQDSRMSIKSPCLRRSSLRLSSWNRNRGKDLGITNVIFFIGIVALLSLSQHENQSSELEHATKSSYYCRYPITL